MACGRSEPRRFRAAPRAPRRAPPLRDLLEATVLCQATAVRRLEVEGLVARAAIRDERSLDYRSRQRRHRGHLGWGGRRVAARVGRARGDHGGRDQEQARSEQRAMEAQRDHVRGRRVRRQPRDGDRRRATRRRSPARSRLVRRVGSGVVSGSLNHCSDTTTGALQGRSTELPRAIEGNRRSSTAGQISGEEPIVREWPQLL
jgi:hypothetical protein